VAGRGPFGGYFIATEIIPPDVNDTTINGTTPRRSLVGPAGEELGIIDGDGNYTWIERDAMGREVGSWRESATGPRTLQPISRTYYALTGQVLSTWDGNFDTVTRVNTYDEAGRLSYVKTDPNTGEGIEYRYLAGDLGRVSQVVEWTYPGGVATSRVIAANHYDFPYGDADADYPHVAEKLSWTDNGETQINYGYDDAGRVSRRDQWFAKLGGITGEATRFTVSSTYGGDGRVLESRVVNPFDAAKAYRYNVDYDSAARPVALSGNYVDGNVPGSEVDLTARVQVYEAAATAGVGGAYDALGRVPLMKADAGRVVSARLYDGYSGALTGECKRFEAGTSCTSLAVDAAKDLFRTDKTVLASYQGGKLKSFKDDLTQTSYAMSYLPSGRLSQLRATPWGAAVGPLTQDWTENYTFNGVGNLSTVGVSRNTSTSPNNPRADYAGTATYAPVSAAARPRRRVRLRARSLVKSSRRSCW